MDANNGQLDELYAVDVVTQDDDNLGKVGQVYLDDQTSEPSWVSVRTGWFGTNESLVPLEGAQVSGGQIRVPYSKDTIKDAPNVDADTHLSEQQQDELFRYYGGMGMDVSRYGSRDDLGSGVDTRDDLAGVGTTGGVRGMDTTRDDRGDRADEGSMTLHEERVDVGTEQVETGRVRLRKHVVTDQETVTVPVEREEYEIVREPADATDLGAGDRLEDDEAEVVLHEERPVVDKDVVATERVGLEKQTVTDEQQVVTDVSREEVDVDEDMGERVDDGLRDDLDDDVRDDLGRDGRRDI